MQMNQQFNIDTCNQKGVEHKCRQTASEFVSSAPVLRRRNLRASLVMGWQAHVTQNECWQAGHLNPDSAKSFCSRLMVV